MCVDIGIIIGGKGGSELGVYNFVHVVPHLYLEIENTMMSTKSFQLDFKLSHRILIEIKTAFSVYHESYFFFVYMGVCLVKSIKLFRNFPSVSSFFVLHRYFNLFQLLHICKGNILFLVRGI